MQSASSLFLLAAGAHLLAVMSPGPDFAMVVRQTLAQGSRAGVWTAIGIGSGIGFHVTWALFGLGWIVERYPAALEALRYAGAAFLLWMGVGALRARPSVGHQAVAAEPVHSRRHFLIGLVTNLLNPKAMLFFVALCSVIVSQHAGVPLRLALGAWICGTTMAWFSLVAWSLGHPALRERLQAQAHWIDRAMGAVLVALGLLTLVSG